MKFLTPPWMVPNKGYIRQIIVCFSVIILPFVSGIQAVWPSLAIERIASGAAGFAMDRDQIAKSISAFSLSTAFAPLLLRPILKRLGRKTNLCLTGIFLSVGWLLITFARSPTYIVLASVTFGFGLAVLMIDGPIFLSEIADKRIRGALIATYVTSFAVGQVFYTTSGIFIPYFELNLITLIFSLLSFFTILILATESPSYLLMISDEAKAEKSFRYFWTGEDDEKKIKAALASLKESVDHEMKSSSSFIELFRTRSNKKALFIVTGLSVLQPFGGVFAMLAFASTTLPKYDGLFQPNFTMAAVNILELLFNIISTGLFDKLGRKPMIIISSIGSALGTGIFTAYFFIDEYTDLDTTNIKCLPSIGILIYISFFGVGMATVPHLLRGEMFPANVRSNAAIVTLFIRALGFTIVNYLYPWVCRSFGVSVIYLVFTISCLSTAIFSSVFMLETKNLSLAEIQELLGRKSKIESVTES